MKTKDQYLQRIYYCKLDAYGQRTGEVFSTVVNRDEITKSVHGFDMHKGQFIFYCPIQAQRAALN